MEDKVDEKLDELRDLLAAQVRRDMLNDIVESLASIDWTDDSWPKQIDHLVDEISAKVGGEGRFGYLAVYLMQRLIARGRVKVTATSWPLSETGEIREGFLGFRSSDHLVEGCQFDLDGDDDGISLSIRIEAQE